MLLRTLLRKVVEYVEAHPIDTGSLIIKIEASQRNMTAEQFISTVDVRNLGTLRAVLPQAFPKKLRTGEIEAKRNIYGAWRVDPLFQMPDSWDPARRQDSGGYYG